MLSIPNRCFLALPLAAAAGLCAAQSAPAAAPASAAQPAVKAVATKAHVKVIEDDNVRIEETKVRGQTQRIVVHSKMGDGKSYEIIVPPGGKDPSQDRGTSGQRAWSLFAF